jgi:predicted nucleic acid-binding protein
MACYADTSVIVAYYGHDALSPQAQSLMRSLGQSVFFTALHRLEIKTALKLAVFRGRRTPLEAADSLGQMSVDVRARKLRRTRLDWEPVFRTAARMGWAHSAQLGVRSFDALHVAAAVALGTRDFLSFDARQRSLAQAVGLVVLPSFIEVRNDPSTV